MLKMENAHKSELVSEQELHRNSATLKSHKINGYDYHIVNQYVREESIKFTYEQAIAMFENGIPLELLAKVPAVDMAKVHEWRIKNDPEYKAISVKHVKETKVNK